jgi:aconitate hydratase A / 2-methylisocitrate dehydratase
MEGVDENIKPGAVVKIKMRKEDQTIVFFNAVAKLNTLIEVEYYRNGGVLNTVLKNML